MMRWISHAPGGLPRNWVLVSVPVCLKFKTNIKIKIFYEDQILNFVLCLHKVKTPKVKSMEKRFHRKILHAKMFKTVKKENINIKKLAGIR